MLSTETRISTVTFVFDGADRLVKIETPEDVDRVNKETDAELRKQAKDAKVNAIRDSVLEARKLILSSEARGKLDRALELLAEVP